MSARSSRTAPSTGASSTGASSTGGVALGDGGIALVTGATSGIGLAFARRLAADGHDLVIVARNQDGLDQVAADLRSEFGVSVETISADLSQREQMDRVAHRLADRSAPVDILVNGAGFGLGMGFLSSTVADEERLLAVHCQAVLVLSHVAAQGMRDRGRGWIINVSSVASFAAMGTYSAAKAWMTVFSEALAGQLAPHGIRVTAVCPGFVRTEFHGRATIDMSALPGFGWLDVDRVTAEGLVDAARGRVISVPSKRYKVVAFASRHAPRPLVRRLSGGLQSRRTHS